MEQNDRGEQEHQVRDILLLTHFTHHLRHGILPPSPSHRSHPQAGRPFFPFLFPPLRGFYPHGGAWSDIRWRKLKVLWDRARQSSGLCRLPSPNLCDLPFFLRHTLASQRWVDDKEYNYDHMALTVGVNRALLTFLFCGRLVFEASLIHNQCLDRW